jgi:hypothetical protein
MRETFFRAGPSRKVISPLAGFDFQIHADFVNRPYISYLRTATLGTNLVQPRENFFLSQ